MAQIVYTGENGEAIVVKNPTAADYDKMWRIIGKRIGPALAKEFVKELQKRGSILTQQSMRND